MTRDVDIIVMRGLSMSLDSLLEKIKLQSADSVKKVCAELDNLFLERYESWEEASDDDPENFVDRLEHIFNQQGYTLPLGPFWPKGKMPPRGKTQLFTFFRWALFN